MALTYADLYEIQEKRKKKSNANKTNDIAPTRDYIKVANTLPSLAPIVPNVSVFAPTRAESSDLTAEALVPAETTNKSSYFADGYDLFDISRTILRSRKQNEAEKEQKESAFDSKMMQKYSSMSLTDIEKELARLEEEEKTFKAENGGKFTNYLSKVGSYFGEGVSGKSLSSARAKSEANIDTINDYTREKEILNTYRKQRATEEYLSGLSKEQLQLLDNISKADDLEKAKPLALAMQGDNADMAGLVYYQQTKGDMDASDDAFTTLSEQLKKKFPDKGNDEIYELINNMVELRKNQVNAEERATLEAQSKEFATEHPVGAFALSRGATFVSGMTGLVELAYQWNNEYGLDTNAPGFLLTHTSNTIDEQIQLDHDWQIDVGDSSVDAFDLFYKAGTGVVDNLARYAMAGGNSTVAGAMMFTQGTTQSIIAGKEKGYSDAKALTLGLLDGTFEAISEKISLDIIFKDGGGVLKTLAKSFAAEGGEEVTSNWLNRIADEIANGNHSELSKMYEAYKAEGLTDAQAMAEVVLSAVGEDVESFVIGGLSGAVMGGGNVAVKGVSNAIQQNEANKLTDIEQQVVDKVVEDRIAEATEDGKKLTKAEEKKIREEVRRALDRGYIDTDTIESVLGGEDYQKYKKLYDARAKYEQSVNDEIKALQEEHKKLQEEYEELNKLALTEAKLGDHNRQAEIKARQKDIDAKIDEVKAELKELEADTSVSDLKARFDENFVNVYKGSRLEESYRRKQIFEADFEKFKGTKHEDAARKSLENAVKAGADNSKGMRTLVESNARFSANTGVVFEYTTNEKEIQAFTKSQTEAIKEIEEIPEAQRTEEQNKLLAEMKGTLEKVQSGDMVVDGTKKTGVITVNLDSPKALNVITGHEIAHLLEKAKHYKKAQDALFKYASMKGVNIEEELDNRARKYGGIKDSDSKAELFADLVGGYLYTDYDFVVHLANTDQSVFHSMWDSVKYLYKMATAGSKEARQLERVKRNFEKAYKEFTKSGAKVEGEKYSITEPFVDKNGNRYENAVLLDTGAFDNVSPKNWWKVLKNHLENRVEESTFIMPVADESGNTQMLEFAKSNERVSKNGGKQHKVLGELYMTSDNISKLSAIHIDEIVEVSESDVPYHTEADGHGWLDANGWLHRTAYVINAKNGSIYQVTMDIAKTEDGRHILYALNGKTKKVGNAEVNSIVTKATKGSSQNSNFDDILPQNSEKSIGEANYSLTSEQEEYFKDSKVRDENGNLKVMYHGTSKGGFTSFDTYGSNYGLMGTGSYFTDNKSVAESYTNKGKGNNKQVYESYLNITNPLDMDAEGNAEEWAKAFPDVDFPDSGTNEDFYRAVEEFYSDQMMPKWEAAEEIRDSIQFGMGYDGITHIGGGRVNADGERHQVYIAFEPEQIKNIDNIAPTKDADIRYSLSDIEDSAELPWENNAKDSEGNKLTQKQIDYFEGSQAVDRNGNLLKVYHTTKNDFTVFDKGRKGEATEDANTYLGFFFTDDAEYMQNFPEFENGKTESYYLNMKNPIDMTDISEEAFLDIVEVMGGDVDEAADVYAQELADEQDRAKLRGDNNVSLTLSNLFNELTGEFYYDDFIRELQPHYDELMSKGYDGVINYMDELFGVKEYIVLDSNQAKLTSNKNPSADSDVRYSLSDSEQSDNDVKVLNGSAITKYSLSTWTPETQTKVRNNLIKAGYDGDQVDKWIKDTNGVASVIAANKDRLDFVAADNQVMLKDNQEYIKTLDASTLCAKRLVYQGTFDAIQHRMPNTMLSSDDLIDLLNMMKEHGVQTPCGVCYVESRRRHLGKFAQDWLNNYNGEYKPNLDEVTTSDGLEALRKSHPQTYKDFVDAMNRKGSSNPKVVQLRTEYRNEIMSLTPSQIRKIEAIGGLRVQSFSDFETPHMLDMMQAVMDMSAKGLHSQAYTKVPNFAWVFGDTGIKINLSLIAEGDGFDSDGNLAFSSVEGIDFDEAMRLRNAYSQNVGTIIVGANDKHILACMADDRIDFIIPFHRSGWGMNELEMMGMTSYTDYTYGQKEHDLNKPTKIVNGVQQYASLENLYPPDYWDYTLSGKENAERYLNLCAKTGREPKFSNFLVNNGDGSYSLQPDGSTDGYWKTLIDFKMYDNEGNGAAQQKVQPNFNMAEAYRVLNEYEGGANSLPVANDVVEEFVAKHKNGTLHSLSEEGDTSFAPDDSWLVYGNRVTVPDDIAPMQETVSKAETVEDIAPTVAPTEEAADTESKPAKRSELHQSIIDRIKGKFTEKGFDFDDVLNKAKNLTTVSTNDNTPQRVMEKALGYKQGQILADETINKVAQNETEGIKWLNSFTDRKNGVLAQISKQYNIKPGSKKSAAAQMYAEGFYVNKNNEIVKYGDRELAIDFPDAKVQANIKGLARDPRIRQIYDETLAAINESRSRNLYPEIPRLDNYFLHFRAMEDTFSRLGLPFNPNDIRAHDLPTDLNGVTADLKPGQPYFASAMHREGMRTSFDLLGGLERYLSSAKNQIYHIDDIQNLRALRNYIADTYGQAKGLESLDNLSEEEAQERITQVYSSHLSTFAKFLHEEANILAGKKTLIDRGIEGAVGRKWFAFFDTVNKQVGSNMVGFNVSSSLTNFLPVVQTFAKTNKFDFTKAFTQTVASKIGSIFGKTDSFVENNPTIIRRKGAERFYRTPFQKAGDAGYVLMSAVDDISTELIVRTKYNELTRKGMDEQKASFEADKWVSRLMGDRSLGQMPLWYNSKMLGLVTKFQLEVRNQLDSQFYDTIQEAKVSNEDIENGLLRNAKTAAKIGSTFFQLAVAQHIFGKAFESVAGYNPAFDIIEVLIKTLGLDDDEEDEDTPLDNLKEGFYALLEDLPYTSVLRDGGRIPISSALPVKQIFSGKDKYGNEKSIVETLEEIAPYYLLPTGYGQIKKTAQGLNMFSDEHPVAGSYTDSGNLRFPVEDTPMNRLQAGVFGQYANKNAQTYFDEGYAPLKEKQIQEYVDSEMPIEDYWKYREGLSGLSKIEEKADYVYGLDLPIDTKNLLINNLTDRKEPIDLTDYGNYDSFEEFDYAQQNPEKYAFLEAEGIGYNGYKELDADTKEAWSWAFKNQDEYRYYKENGVYPGDYSVYRIPMLDFANEDNDAYSWAFDNPEKATFSKAITDDVVAYRKITSGLYEIRADKDSNGKTINGSAKAKKKEYIWSLDIDDGAKYILFKNEYNSVDDYNYEIIDYLNGRDDISYDEMNTILEQIGFTVDKDTGYISW